MLQPQKNKKQGTVLDFALICDIFYLGKVQSCGAVLLFRVHACICVGVGVCVCVCVCVCVLPFFSICVTVGCNDCE